MIKIFIIALLVCFGMTSPAFSSDEVNLNVLTLNTWNIPILRKKMRKRSRLIGHHSRDYDIASYQEVFGKTPRRLISTYINRGNEYDKHYQKTPPLRLNSGLVNYSKAKIIDSSFMLFKNCTIIQCIAAKGMLHTRLLLENGVEIDVFNTHMEPGVSKHKIRKKQLKNMIAHIKKVNQGLRPKILLGDFNIIADSDEYNYIMSELVALGFVDTWKSLRPHEPGFTYDSTVNPFISTLFSSKEKIKRIDYILVASGSEAHVDLHDVNVVFDHKYKYFNSRKSYFLSDHFGVDAQISVVPD